jgi:hypothetical protein
VVNIFEAYYRAAIEWNGVGKGDMAIKFARNGLAAGLPLFGFFEPLMQPLKDLANDATGHPSWRFRLSNALREATSNNLTNAKEE